MAQRQTDLAARGQPTDAVVKGVSGIEADHAAPVILLELVAVGGAFQRVGEVGVQVEPIAQRVGRDAAAAALAAAVPLGRQAAARRVAAGRRIERVEAAEGLAVVASGVDQPLRDLVGRGPACGVAHQAGAPALGKRAAGQGQQTVLLAQPLGHRPGPVAAHQFHCAEQGGARGHLERHTSHAAAVVAFAKAQLTERGIELSQVDDVSRAGRGKVTARGEVRSLAVLDALHQLGQQEVQVGVALAMAMGGHVDRHAVDAGSEVGAVVEVEAAQEVLVGLAVARVLGDDQAGHELEHFAGAQGRAALQQLAVDHALRGGVRSADSIVVVAALDLDTLGSGGLGGGWGLGAGSGASQRGDGAG